MSTVNHPKTYPTLIPNFQYASSFIWLLYLTQEQRSQFFTPVQLSTQIWDNTRQNAIINALGHTLAYYLDATVTHIPLLEDKNEAYKITKSEHQTLYDGNGLIRRVSYKYKTEKERVLTFNFDEKATMTHTPLRLKPVFSSFDQLAFFNVKGYRELELLKTSYEVYGSSIGYRYGD